MFLINFWLVLVFLVAFLSLKQDKNEGELCVTHGNEFPSQSRDARKRIREYYISFRSSGSQESNASNNVQFEAEMKKLWPIEGNCAKLKKNFALTFLDAKIFALAFPDAKIFALTFPNAKIFTAHFPNAKIFALTFSDEKFFAPPFSNAKM